MHKIANMTQTVWAVYVTLVDSKEGTKMLFDWFNRQQKATSHLISVELLGWIIRPNFTLFFPHVGVLTALLRISGCSWSSQCCILIKWVPEPTVALRAGRVGVNGGAIPPSETNETQPWIGGLGGSLCHDEGNMKGKWDSVLPHPTTLCSWLEEVWQILKTCDSSGLPLSHRLSEVGGIVLK